MPQQKAAVHDPWRELSRETRQVDLDEVLSRMAVEERTKQALKKALLDRVEHLIRSSC